MLSDKKRQELIDFVAAKPRTVHEISLFLKLNWRTADRYIAKIAQESGAIASRVFREGTRAALKIVYPVHPTKISESEFQDRLLQRILLGKKKEDFSPLDLYQYVEPKHRRAFVELQQSEYAIGEQDIISLFQSAKQQILIFSGNLSWAQVKQHKTSVSDVLYKIAKSGIPIKVVTRVDIASIRNTYKILEINERLGREAIEIRHVEQPLRAVIIDGKVARFKEVKSLSQFKRGELRGNTFLFYDILDPEWVEWLQRVFFVMYRTAIPAAGRLETLKSIERAEVLG